MLPDHVGRVVIEPKIWARNRLEHAVPNRGANGKVLASGPLVRGEQHGAVFDADLDATFFGQGDDRSPNFDKASKVLIHGPRPIATNKGVEVCQAQVSGRLNDLLNMVCSQFSLSCIRSKCIRIIAKAARRNARLFSKPGELFSIGSGIRVHIDMGDACITSFGFPVWPTHDLHAVVTDCLSCLKDLFEAAFGQNRAYKT